MNGSAVICVQGVAGGREVRAKLNSLWEVCEEVLYQGSDGRRGSGQSVC